MSGERAVAEAAVLGACLIDPQAYWRVADLLNADDFASPPHRALWAEIATSRNAGHDADSITIAESKPDLESTIRKVTSDGFATKMVRGYAEWVASAAVHRRVLAAGQRIAKLSPADSLGEAQRILASCQPRSFGVIKPLSAHIAASYELMHERYESEEPITGLPTSIEGLDDMLSGWQDADLIVVAARPSVGKTAFVVQSALHAASLKRKRRRVAMFSLEQSGLQLADRALSHLSGVSFTHIMRPKQIVEAEWALITAARLQLMKLPFVIDDQSGLTVEAIGARARQLNAEEELALIVIDYLQLIAQPKADKVADAVQIITRALKALAKELNVPIVLLSQLNREGEDKPTMKTLRDSGAIEQDADVIVFLHRPNKKKRSLIQAIVEKQRNGPLGEVWLEAQMHHMRFVETEHEQEEEKSHEPASFDAARKRR